MSEVQTLEGKTYRRWDCECPKCNHEWDFESDPLGDDDYEDTECPKCEASIRITASWSVNYDVELLPALDSK